MLAVGRDAAARHDHVHVRVMGERRAPGVQHGGDADAGAEVLRIGGDRQQGLGRDLEQEIVDHRLVLVGDVGDGRRQREHDVIVRHRQQLGLAVGEPVLCGGALALRAMPVAAGKSRYEVRLPLPQDVGDAIAAYLECRPSTRRNDVLFLRTIAPCRPFRRGDGISSAVKRIMKRADIVPPVKGAHALRHSAATEMLRHGVPLDKIGLVLRHRGIDTTAYYATAGAWSSAGPDRGSAGAAPTAADRQRPSSTRCRRKSLAP
ncbi:hypothetical protein ACVWXO_006123 [Bradyrhizobium sp. LM2.7]